MSAGTASLNARDLGSIFHSFQVYLEMHCSAELKSHISQRTFGQAEVVSEKMEISTHIPRTELSHTWWILNLHDKKTAIIGFNPMNMKIAIYPASQDPIGRGSGSEVG